MRRTRGEGGGETEPEHLCEGNIKVREILRESMCASDPLDLQAPSRSDYDVSEIGFRRVLRLGAAREEVLLGRECGVARGVR